MSRKARNNVGLIGLGIIGSRVAAGLRAAGFQVYVWNRSAKPAPNFLGSPAEIAKSADIIQIFVADAVALFEVIEAMSDALTPRHIILCNATVGPEAVLEAAQFVEARGAQFLDAPFTGSKLAAEKRQLVYYIGGAEPAFLRARPVLEATSKSIIRIGAIGHASTVKVVTNMISAVTAQVLAEALCIVQKAGLEPEVLGAAIEQNACRSGVIDLKLPKMIGGDYEPHFSLKHMFKDIQLGIHMANALDVDIPVSTVAAGVMYGALNQGWGDLDFSVVFKNYTEPELREEQPVLNSGVQPDAPTMDKAESTPRSLPAPEEENLAEESEENADERATTRGPFRSLETLATPGPVHTAPITVVPRQSLDGDGAIPVAEPGTDATRIIEAVPATGTAEPPASPERQPATEVGNSAPAEAAKPVAEPAAKTGVSAPASTAALSESAVAVAEAAAAALASSPEATAPPNNRIPRWRIARPR